MFYGYEGLGPSVTDSLVKCEFGLQQLGDSPFFVYKHRDATLPYTRFAKPSFTYKENLSFEEERQQREHAVFEKVKERLLESADRSCRQRARHCKEKQLKIDDSVYSPYSEEGRE